MLKEGKKVELLCCFDPQANVLWFAALCDTTGNTGKCVHLDNLHLRLSLTSCYVDLTATELG